MNNFPQTQHITVCPSTFSFKVNAQPVKASLKSFRGSELALWLWSIPGTSQDLPCRLSVDITCVDSQACETLHWLGSMSYILKLFIQTDCG